MKQFAAVWATPPHQHPQSQPQPQPEPHSPLTLTFHQGRGEATTQRAEGIRRPEVPLWQSHWA